VGLYIHIPFCKAKCHYCDFSAFAGKEGLIDSYLVALRRELETFSGFTLSSLFIGGGTPTVLSNSRWASLLTDLHRLFHFLPDAEFTVEANPETLTPEKARTLREWGVNRLSFGLQTTDDKLLKDIGRIHDFSTFQRAYRFARDAGFSNINIDLIYGLPGQSLGEWQDTLRTGTAENPEHISAYALTVEEDTAFGRQGVSTNSDLQADMYLWTHEYLQAQGYRHYEISNFSRPGRECRHNLLYWENRDFIGVGCSAASHLQGERWQNDPTLEGYLQKVTSDADVVVHRERLEGRDKTAEEMILRLRLADGLPKPLENKTAFGKVLTDYMGYGFLKNRGERIVPTVQGWLLSNRLFRDLLIAAEIPS
jgi:oxygen-independent coproporphyrinogen-3 oxidase